MVEVVISSLDHRSSWRSSVSVMGMERRRGADDGVGQQEQTYYNRLFDVVDKEKVSPRSRFQSFSSVSVWEF